MRNPKKVRKPRRVIQKKKGQRKTQARTNAEEQANKEKEPKRETLTARCQTKHLPPNPKTKEIQRVGPARNFPQGNNRKQSKNQKAKQDKKAKNRQEVKSETQKADGNTPGTHGAHIEIKRRKVQITRRKTLTLRTPSRQIRTPTWANANTKKRDDTGKTPTTKSEHQNKKGNDPPDHPPT